MLCTYLSETCDCSEKDINVGPTAIMALMTAKISHYGPEYAVLLTFFTGIVILVAGFLRLGFLIDFFSLPVIAGFTSAAAITIASSQVGSLDQVFKLSFFHFSGKVCWECMWLQSISRTHMLASLTTI